MSTAKLQFLTFYLTLAESLYQYDPGAGFSPSQFPNIFFSETTGLLEQKLHMSIALDRGTSICSKGPGDLTKAAVMPIYGKTILKIFLSRTRGHISVGLVMHHWG